MKSENVDGKTTVGTERKMNLKGIAGNFKFLSQLDGLFLTVALLSGLSSAALYPTAFWIYGNVIKLIVEYSRASQPVSNLTCPNRYVAMQNNTDLVSSIAVYIYQYVYFGIGILITHFLAYLLWGLAIERVAVRIRSELFKSIISQEISWFDSFKHGECNLLYSLIDKMKLAYGSKFIDFVILINRSIACFIFAYYSCWKLALALTGVMPISILFFVVTIITMKKYTVAENRAHASVMSLGEEVLSAIKVVIAYNGQQSEINNFDRLLNTAKEITIKKGTVVGLTSGVASFFNSASYAVLIGFGTFVFQTDCNFDSGNIIQTFAALIIATLAISQALPFVKEFSEGHMSAKKISEILNKKSIADVFNRHGLLLNDDTNKGLDLELKNVSFKYPSNGNKTVIKNLNFKIPSGKTVGICGPSGCGKSTLTRLLMRIYEPTSGTIMYGKNKIEDFQLEWWRSQISIVSQDTAFFTMSIKENIRLANPGASDLEIKNAAIAANADKFIQRFPQGYDTIIGPKGKDLSGGEKQRISIARAFLRKSRLLILDEATSALDNESEGLVQESMERLKRGKTTIIIAHRLTTIKDADLIVEMQDGKITDSGRHEELVKRKGFYFSLLNAVHKAGDEKKTKVKSKQQALDVEDEADVEIKIVDPVQQADCPSPQRKVWELSKPELHWIVMTGFASFLQGSIYPLIAFCFCQLVEIFSLTDSARQTQLSLTFTGVVLGLAVVSFFAQFFQSFSATKSGAELTTRVRHMLFSSMIHKDFIYFTKPVHKPQVLMAKMASKSPLLKGYTSERVGIILNFISSVGIPLIMSLVFSWKLALLISLFIPVALIWGFMQGQFLRGNQKLSGAAKLKDAVDIASEAMSGVYTVTLFNLQQHFLDKVNELFYSNTTRITVILIIEAFFYGLGYTLYFFVQAATFSYGSMLLQKEDLEAKVMIFVFLSILFSSMYLGKNISSLPDVPKAKKAAEWVFNVIYADQPVIESAAGGIVLNNFKGNITFSNVHFKYPDSDNEILKGVSLKFNSHESNALVGNSGGGKSTIMSLIQRFYDATSGTIKFDDVDITKLDVNWLRSKIAIVFQEPILFNRTIKENITYGLDIDKVSMEQIIDAASKAAIHSKISELPDGYDTVITANMLTFSGGEKQRLSIARALIRLPQVLLLDEATSALDNISEGHIQSVLDEAVQSRTSIMIAHRLSTIVNANKIVVVKDGKVVEQGDHNSLMNNRNFYFELQTTAQSH